MSTFIKRLNNKAPKGVLIYLLGFYVLVQFCWWAYMLVSLNSEIYQLRLELLTNSEFVAPEKLIMKGELDQKLTLRVWMVLGEGAVFVFILLLGFWAVRKSIAKELLVASQQKNFLLSITHELKSPLAAIKLQLQTLQSRALTDEKKSQLYARALGDTTRLEKLVENLLLVNKIESGRLPLLKRKLNVSEDLDQLIRSFYPNEIENQRIGLEIESNIHAEMDEMSLQSIVINLVDNGIKYGANSSVSISLKQTSEKMLLLSVSDGGSGIPNNEKEKIFDRFYRRGNENVRQTKGTGIGLYLVKLLVTQHDGTIRVEDNDPKGTRFAVSLPMVE